MTPAATSTMSPDRIRHVASGDADIIIGSHISAVRVALRKVIAGHIPYIYTPVYEGGERTPGVMAIGETPGSQSRPAIEWLANIKKASRWYLIGSDYVWPWLSHRATKKYIAGRGRARRRRRVRAGSASTITARTLRGSAPRSPTWFSFR